MPFNVIKTAIFNTATVIFSICLTVVLLPYLIYDFIFGDKAY
jgi:hypothetical protein